MAGTRAYQAENIAPLRKKMALIAARGAGAARAS